MRVVIAPDSFKGTATAAGVAEALAAGWHDVRPGDDVQLLPMADGGEGSLDAFATAFPTARRHPLTVQGPLEELVDAAWLELPGRVGVVELAATSGITLLSGLAPDRAHTLGFGQALRAVIDAGMREVVACIGGSASNDAGAGMLVGLGARLLDDRGAPCVLGARGLDDLALVDSADLLPPPAGGVRVVTDVDAPLLGPAGAVRTYGPQKGVAAEDFDLYERRIARLVDLLGGDPTLPGAGAAGGVGAALAAWGAVLHPGAEEIAEHLDLDRHIAAADLVLTGEGRFDGQSAAGKVPDYVARAAARHQVPAALVAGRIDSPTHAFAVARSLVELADSEPEARARTAEWLRAAGRSLAAQARPRHGAEP